MRNIWWPVCGVLTLSLLTACENPLVDVSDDMNPSLNVAPGSAADDIHSPYVRGMRLSFSAQQAFPQVDHSAWTATSSDEGVLQIENVASTRESGSVNCFTKGDGTATLTFWMDAAKTRKARSFQVEVVTPDDLHLIPRASLMVDEDKAQPLDGALQVLEGHKTILWVRYFKGGRELAGRNVLTAEPADAFASSDVKEDRFLSKAGTALKVGSSFPGGEHPVELRVAGTLVKTLQVVAVPEAELTSVRLRLKSELGVGNGSPGAVVGEGVTANDRPVFGVPLAWTIGGSTLETTGDLFSYSVDGSTLSQLDAAVAGKSASVTIRAKSGTVTDLSVQSCAQSGPGLLGVWFLAVWAWIGRARRGARKGVGCQPAHQPTFRRMCR